MYLIIHLLAFKYNEKFNGIKKETFTGMKRIKI